MNVLDGEHGFRKLKHACSGLLTWARETKTCVFWTENMGSGNYKMYVWTGLGKLAFRQGLGLTSNDALNCRLWAAVRMVRGRFGPRRPSRGRPPPSSSQPSSSPIPRQKKIYCIMLKLTIKCLIDRLETICDGFTVHVFSNLYLKKEFIEFINCS